MRLFHVGGEPPYIESYLVVEMILFIRVVKFSIMALALFSNSAISQSKIAPLVDDISTLQRILLSNQYVKILGSTDKDDKLFYELVLQRQAINIPEVKPETCNRFVGELYKVSCQLMILSDVFFNYDWSRYAALYQKIQREHPDLIKNTLIPIDDFDMLINSPPFRHLGGNKEYKVHFSSIDDNFLNAIEKLHVPVKINGEATMAIFDTGASITLISAELAKKSNAKILPFTSKLSSFYGNGAEIKFALISKLEIGSETFENIIVAVYGSMTLIGFDVMSKLNGLSLSHDSLILNPNGVNEIENCKSPVKLKSNFSRTSQIPITTITVNGKESEANIDTGNNSGYLTHFILPEEYKSGASVRGSKDVVGEQGIEKVSVQRLRLGSLSEINVKVNSVVGSQKIIKNGREFILGSHMLRDYNLYLNFKNGWGCIYNAS